MDSLTVARMNALLDLTTGVEATVPPARIPTMTDRITERAYPTLVRVHEAGIPIAMATRREAGRWP